MKPGQRFLCSSCEHGCEYAEGVLSRKQATSRLMDAGWALVLGAAFCPACASVVHVGGKRCRCQECQSRRLVRAMRKSLEAA